ncbi:MAG: N-acetylgalactosamine-6-sulfatase, partial [Acidobacteriota bacterium]|nr:N-acetylgalactosamine-6-sulfatase [Acidobacteriota bacterium]
ILPTAAALAKAPVPLNIDGISMMNALLGKRQRGHDFLYWEFHERGFDQAVRMGQWKAVRHGLNQPLELYNLRNDIGEQTNVAGKHSSVVAKIEAYLKRARTESERWKVKL